jgi:hypothetical protein
MAFQFSSENRTLLVQHFNDNGLYLGTTSMLIEANTGLPAKSTLAVPPAVSDNDVAVYAGGEWSIVPDYRGTMLYSKDRITVNDYEQTALGELPLETHTMTEPPAFSVWGSEANEWVSVLSLVKANAISLVNAWRRAEESNTAQKVILNTFTWDADPTSQTRILSTLQSDFDTVIWTDADNVDREITKEYLSAVFSAIVEHGFAIHSRQRKMKGEIGLMTTVAEIEAYSIGWSV